MQEDELAPYEDNLSEPSDGRIAEANRITIEAIKNCGQFSNLFENPVVVSEHASPYIVFRANDSVMGLRVAVKCTNPVYTSLMPDGGRGSEDALAWEEAAVRLLASKTRCVKLHTPFSVARITCRVGGEQVNDRISFLATIWLPLDIKRCFFDKKRSLESCLKPAGMAPQKALRLMAEILHSVQVLHRKGLCHRDLKPANVRGCSFNGQTFLCAIDLESSLVRRDAAEDFPRRPAYSGTTAYAAPEMLCGLHDDWELALQADWYAAGCMFFELFDTRLFYPSFIEENGRKKYESMMDNLYSCKNIRDAQERKKEYFRSLDMAARDIVLPKMQESECIPGAVMERIQRVYRRPRLQHERIYTENLV